MKKEHDWTPLFAIMLVERGLDPVVVWNEYMADSATSLPNADRFVQRNYPGLLEEYHKVLKAKNRILT